MINKFFLILGKIKRTIRNGKYKLLLSSFGNGSQICNHVIITDPQWTQIGNNTRINDHVVLLAMSEEARIIIGNNVSISFGAKLLCGGRSVVERMVTNVHNEDNIIIGDNVWIGSGAVILKGVEIGENSIIGANAVVNTNVPSNTLFAGVPAKFIKEI